MCAESDSYGASRRVARALAGSVPTLDADPSVPQRPGDQRLETLCLNLTQRIQRTVKGLKELQPPPSDHARGAESGCVLCEPLLGFVRRLAKVDAALGLVAAVSSEEDEVEVVPSPRLLFEASDDLLSLPKPRDR